MVSVYTQEVVTILQGMSNICVPNNAHVIYAYCAYRPLHVQGTIVMAFLDCILISGLSL